MTEILLNLPDTASEQEFAGSFLSLMTTPQQTRENLYVVLPLIRFNAIAKIFDALSPSRIFFILNYAQMSLLDIFKLIADNPFELMLPFVIKYSLAEAGDIYHERRITSLIKDDLLSYLAFEKRSVLHLRAVVNHILLDCSNGVLAVVETAILRKNEPVLRCLLNVPSLIPRNYYDIIVHSILLMNKYEFSSLAAPYIEERCSAIVWLAACNFPLLDRRTEYDHSKMIPMIQQSAIITHLSATHGVGSNENEHDPIYIFLDTEVSPNLARLMRRAVYRRDSDTDEWNWNCTILPCLALAGLDPRWLLSGTLLSASRNYCSARYLTQLCMWRQYRNVREADVDERFQSDFAAGKQLITNMMLTIAAPRVLSICIALQSLHLPALMLLEIVNAAFAETWREAPRWILWRIITLVKHHNHRRHSLAERFETQ